MVVVHGEVAAKVRSAKFLAVTQDRRVCLTQASLTFALRHVPEGENVGDALRATKVEPSTNTELRGTFGIPILSDARPSDIASLHRYTSAVQHHRFYH